MSEFLTGLSFSFVMDLYRIKKGAEERGDASAIQSLNKHYPELFSDNFNDFIEKLKLTITHLDSEYGKNFSEILEPPSPKITRPLN